MEDKKLIKQLMKDKGISQEKLAEIMGLQRTNVTGFLNRGAHAMRVDTFVELVEALGYEVLICDRFDRRTEPVRLSFPKETEE